MKYVENITIFIFYDYDKNQRFLIQKPNRRLIDKLSLSNSKTPECPKIYFKKKNSTLIEKLIILPQVSSKNLVL